MKHERMPWWKAVGVYAAVWAVMELLKAAFPDVMNTLVGLLAPPALLLVIAFLAYKLWKTDVAQPTRRP
jgi:hypothetical protein